MSEHPTAVPTFITDDGLAIAARGATYASTTDTAAAVMARIYAPGSRVSAGTRGHAARLARACRAATTARTNADRLHHNTAANAAAWCYARAIEATA